MYFPRQRPARRTIDPRLAVASKTMSTDARTSRTKPTGLFVGYICQLAFRLCLLGASVYMFATNSASLSASENFGLAHGFNFIDFVFLALAADFLTKFFVHARISAGSLKQYRTYHIPTPATFTGGRGALQEQFAEIAELGKALAEEGRTAIAETLEGIAVRGNSIMVFARRLLNSVDFLRLFQFDPKDLEVDQSLRAVLYRDRAREIVPVIIFWIALNIALALGLSHFNLLNERTALLWSLVYFSSDMICVVLWCPLQLLLMRNRCCTTCQIFNWDAIMVATPLVFVGGWFGYTLFALALVILVRWELAALRHPERFDERTNARLSCAQCKDKLCYLRGPLTVSVHNKDVRAFLHVNEDSCAEQEGFDRHQGANSNHEKR